ncbi:hypothetical protein BX616_008366 [Lobosporangium transversale]|nr:hypothetical protein BX616_008366 [Lobosporangium transversale]
MRPSILHSSFTRCIFTSILYVSLVAGIHAQPFGPTVLSSSTSVFIEGQALYVSGGADKNNTPSPQAFSLDLSTPWSTSRPSYQKISDGGPADYAHPSALLADKQRWYILSQDNVYFYHIPTKKWHLVGNNTSLASEYYLSGAADPETGIIYIPGGYLDKNTNVLMSYSTVENQTYYNTDETNHPDLANLTDSSVVWSTVSKNLLVFGGFISNIPRNNLYAYSPGNGWKGLSATGDIPTPRGSACLVPAYNGTKMVLFGGQVDSPDGPAINDIYILDVGSWAWTKGTPYSGDGAGSARLGSACAITNDLFISWGGSSNGNIASPLLIYNIKEGRWVEDYSPTVQSPTNQSQSPLAQPSTTQTTPPEHSPKPNLGAIIGGSIGGVAAIALVVGLIMIYRRKSASIKGSTPPPTSPEAGTIEKGNSSNLPIPVVESQKEEIKDYDPLMFSNQQQRGSYIQAYGPSTSLVPSPHVSFPVPTADGLAVQNVVPLPFQPNSHPQPKMQYTPYQPKPFVPPNAVPGLSPDSNKTLLSPQPSIISSANASPGLSSEQPGDYIDR